MSRIFPCVLVTFLFLTSNVVAGTSSASFSYDKGLLWINVLVGGSPEPFTFLLDSGAEESVIDQRTAKKLGVKYTSREKIQKVTGSAIAHRTVPVALHFAGATLQKPLLALSLRSASKSCGRRIDGLLGADFFVRRIVQIDFNSNCIRLLSPPFHASNAHQFPITMNYAAMCVPVRVDGTELKKVRLDTGSDLALHWTSASLSKAHKVRLKRSSIGLARSMGRSKLCRVHLGRLSLGSFRTSVHPRPIFPGEDGLLGNAALSRFVVTIDMVKDRLILETKNRY
jgi:hypothetical protein